MAEKSDLDLAWASRDHWKSSNAREVARADATEARAERAERMNASLCERADELRALICELAEALDGDPGDVPMELRERAWAIRWPHDRADSPEGGSDGE